MEKQKKVYVKGLSLKKPHPNAPDFVKFKGSINLPKLREWLKEQKETGNIEGDWVNFDVADPWEDDDRYNISLDTWKPEGKKAVMPEFNDEI
ncbi:MAG: hypothetical protein L7S57_04650 [Luminiphilus sp.]|nr:hypothetical protein [Luminiphilus sp.]